MEMCEMEIWMEKHRLKTTNDISNRKEEQKNKVSEHKVWGQSQMQTYQQGGVGATREAAKGQRRHAWFESPLVPRSRTPQT